MKLAVMMPAYNEGKTIGDVIKRIPRQIDGIDNIEIFVVNDGSSDDTRERALAAGATKVIDNKGNIGLAQTFQNGLNEVISRHADIIVNIDSDGQHDPAEIPALLTPVLKQECDMVIGDRQIAKLKNMNWGNKYGNIIGSWVLSRMIGRNIKDASCGFRAFSREMALKMNIYFKHTYTHETIIQAAAKNLSIKEVPIAYQERSVGKSKLIGNLFSHIKNSSITILRTVLIYRPLRSFFYAGAGLISVGLLLGLRYIYLYLVSGASGHLQSLLLAAVFIIVGFIVIILGLLGDLVANNRKLNEEILYHLRKHD